MLNSKNGNHCFTSNLEITNITHPCTSCHEFKEEINNLRSILSKFTFDHAERPNENTSEETSTSGVAEVQGKSKRVSNRQQNRRNVEKFCDDFGRNHRNVEKFCDGWEKPSYEGSQYQNNDGFMITVAICPSQFIIFLVVMTGSYQRSVVGDDLLGKIDKDENGKCIGIKKFRGMIGSLLYLKQQNSVALSTAEVEYIVVGSCCAQILWMKQQLSDFGLSLDHTPIRCDNTNAINLSKNPVLHSRTKHIEIRHHFLKDHFQKGYCVLEFVETKNQLADIFTKPLPKENLFSIRQELGILDSSHLNS
uniref:Copia protein n=1 Tax=Cajanus cajan TaxID=3821 RepID=A0A151RTK0_CAJCA|nr:Copia protein [Cajanus cajan]